MKKLAIAINSLPFGGLEISVLNLIKGLQKINKYDIVLICICGGELESDFAETGVETRTGGWEDQYKDIDLIINNATGHGYVMAKKLNIPCIEIVHSKYCTYLGKDIEWIITVNDQLKGIVGGSHPEVISKMTTIPLGLEMSEFDPTRKDKISDFTVGVCGRFASVKRYSSLVRPYATVFRDRDSKLLMVGEGEDEVGIKANTVANRVEDKVVLTGYVKNIKDYLAQMDVYCTISSYESFSISTLEAMAMGRPIIATQTDGIMRLLDANSAIMIPAATPGLEGALEGALRQVSTADLAELGQNARKRAELFSMDSMISQYCEIIDRILG